MSHMHDDGSIHFPAQEKAHRSVFRYTWLLTVAFLVGVPAVYVASTNPDESYTAEGALWIEDASRQGSSDGTPMQAWGPPLSSAWIELLRSYQVLDPVVVDQGLNVRFPEEHAQAFASFTLAESTLPAD